MKNHVAGMQATVKSGQILAVAILCTGIPSEAHVDMIVKINLVWFTSYCKNISYLICTNKERWFIRYSLADIRIREATTYKKL